ncbi:hypothetical protein JAAARDRAFT_30989 [Jaapia argillacea MUCL 33604]|uniref:Cytochrome c oxidase assembly protein COX16, mitochondrial n=1 Tax=Jaapia argillacea MUCL 33604 TaxID=933084 RepID=A0A067Q3J3_9AGAM|nr:hypothetical protein JAAARDRAFT_30989 [Jaapia argillacea MUCL 33604]
MSRAAKATLVASVLASAFTVWGVHFLQNQEHENMYQGVLRDDERRKEKLKRREEEFKESQRKRELYERFQTVTTNKDVQGGA